MSLFGLLDSRTILDKIVSGPLSLDRYGLEADFVVGTHSPAIPPKRSITRFLRYSRVSPYASTLLYYEASSLNRGNLKGYDGSTDYPFKYKGL